jgi:positive regulator of sigma E activity
MIEIRGRVVASESAGLWIEAAPGSCDGCRSHCQRQAAVFYLPTGRAGSVESLVESGPPLVMPRVIPNDVADSSQVVIGLDSGERLNILWHSLLLPLVGLLMGVSLSSIISLTDSVVMIGAILGFGIGLFFCQIQTFDKIHIKKAGN